MRLQSVRDLKSELLETLAVPLATPMAATLSESASSNRGRSPSAVTALAVSAQPLDTVQSVHRSVALGVSKFGAQYRLAVRVQRQQFQDRALLEEIRQKARQEVDIRMVGKVVKRITLRELKGPATRSAATRMWYRGNVRPLLIGSSIGHFEITAGTLGAFVRAGNAVCVLSNNHVLANEDRARARDAILQRARLDGGRNPADKAGELLSWIKLKRRGANLVDAAVAGIDEGIAIDPTLLKGVNSGRNARLRGVAPVQLDVGDKVLKIGRTTGPTRGKVTAFELDNVVVEYDIGNLRFDNQIEIEGTGAAAFSDGGDSGSLIVNQKFEAAALLFAGSEQGGRNDRGLTYASPIDTVLNALGATLIT